MRAYWRDNVCSCDENYYKSAPAAAQICDDAKAALEQFDAILESEGSPSSRELFEAAVKDAQNPLPAPKQGERNDLKELPTNGRKLSTGSNRRDIALARLKRDHPEIAARVVSGELSANAAAIEAGFRKKPSPLSTLTRAWPLAR